MTPDMNNLSDRIVELVQAAGIDNFRMENNVLVMCGVRYAVEQCDCDDPMCNGVRLKRYDGAKAHFAAMQ